MGKNFIALMLLMGISCSAVKAFDLEKESTFSSASHVSRVLKMEKAEEALPHQIRKIAWKGVQNLVGNFQKYWPWLVATGVVIALPIAKTGFLEDCNARLAQENFPERISQAWRAGLCQSIVGFGNILGAELEEDQLWQLYGDVIRENTQ